jgi:plasmid stabilization system protein ParE
MACTLSWSPTARCDLWDVLSYISEFDPEAASRFGQSVFGTLERLVDFPESRRVVPEFKDPSLREIICRPCRIVYRLKKNENLVEIARVWHAARGVPEV